MPQIPEEPCWQNGYYGIWSSQNQFFPLIWFPFFGSPVLTNNTFVERDTIHYNQLAHFKCHSLYLHDSIIYQIPDLTILSAVCNIYLAHHLPITCIVASFYENLCTLTKIIDKFGEKDGVFSNYFWQNGRINLGKNPSFSHDYCQCRHYFT